MGATTRFHRSQYVTMCSAVKEYKRIRQISKEKQRKQLAMSKSQYQRKQSTEAEAEAEAQAPTVARASAICSHFPR